MNTVGSSDWAFVVFSLVLLVVAFYLLGSYFAQSSARFIAVVKKTRETLAEWGVERDVYWPANNLLFTARGIGHVLIGVAIFGLFLHATASLDFVSLLGGSLVVTIRIALYSLWLGFSLRYIRANSVQNKLIALLRLRLIFHQRFKRSDLLSMYESLRQAPPIFWEEYTNLPDKEVNEETNRKFREWVTPYQYSQSRSHNRFMQAATVIAIGLAVISAVIAIFT